jgi:uncharacterized protein (DUF1684 family)
MAADPGTELQLADWRRRIAELYADVRAFSEDSPEVAWKHWVGTRERMFRSHPQSPVLPADRPTFRAHHWPYDPEMRFEVRLESEAESEAAGLPDAASPVAAGGFGAGSGGFGAGLGGSSGLAIALPNSGADTLAFQRIGAVTLPFPAGERRLSVFWMEGYAGGLFVAFRDATNGTETYGAGRYVVDAAKSADLGGDPERGTLILDFNFAYQPSCAFDPKWACPLAPPENRLDLAIRAGERLS